MEIFWGSGSGPAWRVLLAAAIKKVPYESKLLSFQKREHKSDEMLAINPRGKVPALRDGDFKLYESIAILVYLDEKFPEPTLFGKTAEEKAHTWCRVMEAESYLGPALSKVSRPLLFNQLPDKEAELKEGLSPMHEELARLEGQLADHDWLAGTRVSAADLVAFPILMALLRGANKPIAKDLNLGLLPLESKYPRLAKWQSRIEAIDGYDKTYPPHWRDG